MGQAVKSLDQAISGYLRHRYLRALGASAVLLGFILTILIFSEAIVQSFSEAIVLGGFGDTQPLSSLEIAYALMFYLLLLTLALMMPALIGVLVDLPHRRVVGAVVLLAMLAGLALSVWWIVFTAAEHIYTDLARHSGLADDLVWIIPTDVLFLLLAAVSYEGIRGAHWLMTCSREDFMSSRGWRPPLWDVVSTTQRHLGLPAFLAKFGRQKLEITAAYLGVAILNTNLISAFIATFFLFAAIESVGSPEPFEWTNALILMIFVVPFVLSVLGFGRVLLAIADRRASKIYQDVREWDERPPVIFLRAFDQDKTRLRAVVRDPLVKLASGVGRSRTMDEMVLENASPYGPVLAIGDPQSPTPPLGAARLYVPGEDDSWRTVVAALVSASKAVIVCPASSEGVRWELDLVSKEALSKTVFVANPNLSDVENEAHFRSVSGVRELAVAAGQIVIALYRNTNSEWQMLTASRVGQQAVAIAVTYALRDLFSSRRVDPSRKKQSRKSSRKFQHSH